MPIVGLSDYARQRGISPAAVTKAIKDGRIKRAVILGSKGKKSIDSEIADQEWAASTDTTMGAPSHAVPRGHNIATQPGGADTPSFMESKAKRESFMAELARLEYEEKSGVLVQVDEVKREAFRAARIVRDSMLNIPDRVAAELAAETDPFRIQQRLSAEIRLALTELRLGEA
jgi:hypothetical protein